MSIVVDEIACLAFCEGFPVCLTIGILSGAYIL